MEGALGRGLKGSLGSLVFRSVGKRTKGVQGEGKHNSEKEERLGKDKGPFNTVTTIPKPMDRWNKLIKSLKHISASSVPTI